MSDEDRQGFEIYGKFFPFVAYEDWLNRDFVLARQLTGVPTEELFKDPLLLQQALIAVAVAHENTENPRDSVVAYVGGLKPEDVKEVGFGGPTPAPLSSSEPSGNGDSSTAISDDDSAHLQENSLTVSSGIHGSDTGSA